MKVVLIILGAILTALSLLLTIAMPVAGIIGVLAGIGLIVWGIKYKKPEPAVVSSVSYQEDIQKTDRHTILVAGFDHHQQELKSLLTKRNAYYDCTKNELVEYYGEDAPIYEYEKATFPLRLEPEPDNEYDRNAVRVFAGDTFVGYVPRGMFPEVSEYASIENVRMYVKVFGGKYKILDYDSEEDYEQTFEPKYYRLSTSSSPVKAVMVFEW